MKVGDKFSIKENVKIHPSCKQLIMDNIKIYDITENYIIVGGYIKSGIYRHRTIFNKDIENFFENYIKN